MTKKKPKKRKCGFLVFGGRTKNRRPEIEYIVEKFSREKISIGGVYIFDFIGETETTEIIEKLKKKYKKYTFFGPVLINGKIRLLYSPNELLVQ